MLIVHEVGHQPDPSNTKEVRRRIEMFVRHQLFMLFAPLGAIFVYQFLVITESATQPAGVALVSLGAGLTLTTLLERALSAAQTTFPPAPESAPPGDTQRTRPEVGIDGGSATAIIDAQRQSEPRELNPRRE
jgi:hypothetical protein